MEDPTLELDHSGEDRYAGLFDAHYEALLGYCARRVGLQDAHDLVAEVFAIAWRRIDDVPAHEAALPWLYGVAHRRMLHHWRRTGRRRRLLARLRSTPRVDPVQPDTQLVQRAEYATVLDALSRLRPVDQEVLRLALWEELPHREIAAVIDCSEVAARKRLERAKRALLREYERLGGSVSLSDVDTGGGDR